MVSRREGISALGRMTPSFRQLYEELLRRLEEDGYVGALREAEHREAFRLLLEGAWEKEYAAMASAGLPTLLDVLNLTANLHNRALLLRLERRLRALEERLGGEG